MQRVFVGPTCRYQVVVGCIPEALLRIKNIRHLLYRKKPGPLVPSVTGNWNQTAPARSQWRNANSLVTNVPIAISPDHIFGWGQAVTARFSELRPTVRLVHPQASQIRRVADLHPCRSDGVSLVMFLVQVNDRTMSRVPQFNRGGLLAFDRDRFF